MLKPEQSLLPAQTSCEQHDQQPAATLAAISLSCVPACTNQQQQQLLRSRQSRSRRSINCKALISIMKLVPAVTTPAAAARRAEQLPGSCPSGVAQEVHAALLSIAPIHWPSAASWNMFNALAPRFHGPAEVAYCGRSTSGASCCSSRGVAAAAEYGGRCVEGQHLPAGRAALQRHGAQQLATHFVAHQFCFLRLSCQPGAGREGGSCKQWLGCEPLRQHQQGRCRCATGAAELWSRGSRREQRPVAVAAALVVAFRLTRARWLAAQQ